MELIWTYTIHSTPQNPDCETLWGLYELIYYINANPFASANTADCQYFMNYAGLNAGLSLFLVLVFLFFYGR